MAAIFVSSRHGDRTYAERLRELLVQAFGDENVWLATGDEVTRKSSDEAVTARVMVVLIGPHWVQAAHADDRARRDIETALKRRIPLIPVLAGRVDLPTALPGDIHELSDKTPIALTDAADLVTRLRRLLATEQAIVQRVIFGASVPASSVPSGVRHGWAAPDATQSARGGEGIFLSYGEEDSAAARRLARELRAQGETTWVYEEDAVPGVSYLTQAYQAIESCSLFVIVASSQSVHSHQVLREVEAAHERSKMIIPVRIGITHQQFMSSNPILRMATGTRVSLSLDDQGIEEIGRKIVNAVRLSKQEKT